LLLVGCGGSSTGSGSGGGGTGGEANPTTVTFTVTGPAPTAVATAVGSGAFTAATLSSGRLTLTVPAGTANFAVAYVCPAAPVNTGPGATEQTDEWVYEASTADGTALTGTCPTFIATSPTGATGTLTGAVDGSAIQIASYLSMTASNSSSTAYSFSPTGATTYDFSFAAPAGSDRVDVMAYDSIKVGLPEDPESVWALAVKDFESQAVPGALDAGSAVVLGAGDQTTSQALSFSDVPAGFSTPFAQVTYLTGNVGEFDLADFATSAVGYPGVPAAVMQPGDSYQFTAQATGELSSTTFQMVQETKTVTATGPVSIGFPAPWSYAGPAPAALPVFDLAYPGFTSTGAAYSDAGLGWVTSAQSTIFLQVVATANWLNGATSLAVPDLSGVSGFLASPPSGQSVSWSVGLGTGGSPDPAPASGQEDVSLVENLGSYKVP